MYILPTNPTIHHHFKHPAMASPAASPVIDLSESTPKRKLERRDTNPRPKRTKTKTSPSKWYFVNVADVDSDSFWATGIPEALQPLFLEMHGCTGETDMVWEEGDTRVTVEDLVEGLGYNMGEYFRDCSSPCFTDEERECCSSLKAAFLKYAQSHGGGDMEAQLQEMCSGRAYQEDLLESTRDSTFVYYRA